MIIYNKFLYFNKAKYFSDNYWCTLTAAFLGKSGMHSTRVLSSHWAHWQCEYTPCQGLLSSLLSNCSSYTSYARLMICISSRPHFGHGAYLETTLRSTLKQSEAKSVDSAFEVVVWSTQMIAYCLLYQSFPPRYFNGAKVLQTDTASNQIICWFGKQKCVPW
jgi:hypothetical protein